MRFDKFASASRKHCDAYFRAFRTLRLEGRLNRIDRGPDWYPTMLLLSQTPTHYTAELFGVTKEFPSEISVIKRKMRSLNSYLGAFDTQAAKSAILLTAENAGVRFSHISVMCSRNDRVKRERYPEIDRRLLTYTGNMGPDDAFNPLDIAPAYGDLWLEDVLLFANWRGNTRARYFQAAWLVERNMSLVDFERRLNDVHPLGSFDLLPTTSESDENILHMSMNLASLANVDHIGEITITKYLEQHPEILMKALDVERIIAQPRLEWLEGNPDPSERAIQPDFILVDDEGRGHICDAKLPLLARASLVKGRRRRRELISGVSEGVAQLANYHDYFS